MANHLEEASGIVTAMFKKAENNGHRDQTIGASIGGLLGGCIGSFKGPIGTAIGAAVGGVFGYFIGEDNED